MIDLGICNSAVISTHRNTTNKNLISINKCYCYEKKKTKQNLNSLNTVICITLPMSIGIKDK